MTVGVVNLFEEVGIQHQHTVRLAGGLGLENLFFNLVFKIAAVVQGRQRITNRLVLQQNFSVFARSDILKSRIKRQIVIIINNVGRSQQPERRVGNRCFDQHLKILNFFLLLNPLQQQTTVIRIGKKIFQMVMIKHFGINAEEFDRIVIGQNNPVITKPRNDNRER